MRLPCQLFVMDQIIAELEHLEQLQDDCIPFISPFSTYHLDDPLNVPFDFVSVGRTNGVAIVPSKTDASTVLPSLITQ